MLFRFLGLAVVLAAVIGCGSSAPAADQSSATAPNTAPATAAAAPAAGVSKKAAKQQGVVGRWVISIEKSAKPMAKLSADLLKATEASYMEFSADGTFKESMMGMDMSGTYELAGKELKTKAKGFDNTDVAQFDDKEGTITFSPGPKRVVFVRGK